MPMSKYITNLFLACMFVCNGSAQIATDSIVSDSLKTPVKFGLRLGADLTSLGRTVFNNDFKGFELSGDYRLTERFYVAGEIGSADKTTDEPNINFSSKGNYLKVGGDFNLYRNWDGMDNMIYAGLRYGISRFSQTINSYIVYTTNQTWPYSVNQTNSTYAGLSAMWLELQFGIKVELLPNMFGFLNLQLKRLVSNQSSGQIDNLYIPGFNRTYQDGQIGSGVSYGISYRIPFYKK